MGGSGTFKGLTEATNLLREACEVQKETGKTPRQLKAQRDTLLTALEMTLPTLEWCQKQWAGSPQQGEDMGVLNVVRAVIMERAVITEVSQ